jgi:carboxyl-terminal processing protease
MLIKALFIFLVASTAQASFLKDTISTEEGKIALAKFVTISEFVSKTYVDEISNKDLLERMTKLLIEDLDPHSTYMDKKEFGQMREMADGNFTGVGMVVEKRKGYVKVVSPIDDTPAYMAGIKSGDRIIKIDGIKIGKKSLEESVKMMRGVPGTSVELTIKRKNKVLIKEIIRAVITIKSVKHKIMDDIGYIRISSFNKNTAGLTNEALDVFNKASIENVILDLRNNPGGLLSAAIEVSDMFMKKGEVVVYTKGRERKRDYFSIEDSKVVGKSIVVLINTGSASASEIVAGALQDTNRATIIGKKSFGKGSVQTLVPMSDGTAIKLTTSLYYTPLGRSIQAKGIVPDIEVIEPAVEDENGEGSMSENDLTGRIENPNGESDLDTNIKEDVLEKDIYITESKKIFAANKAIKNAIKQISEGMNSVDVVYKLAKKLTNNKTILDRINAD